MRREIYLNVRLGVSQKTDVGTSEPRSANHTTCLRPYSARRRWSYGASVRPRALKAIAGGASGYAKAMQALAPGTDPFIVSVVCNTAVKSDGSGEVWLKNNLGLITSEIPRLEHAEKNIANVFHKPSWKKSLNFPRIFLLASKRIIYIRTSWLWKEKKRN